MNISESMRTLAHTVVTYSLGVQPGESVLIDCIDCRVDAEYAVTEAVLKAGAYPFTRRQSNRQLRLELLSMTEAYAQKLGEQEYELLRRMDSYVALRGSSNLYELSDVPVEKQAVYQRGMAKAREQRMLKTKWCVLRYPNAAMAQQCGLSTDALEDYYYACCLTDYRRMNAAAQPLRELMMKTDRVHITGPGVDLRFSIKGCCGHSPFLNDTAIGRMNLPDGEVGGSAVKQSAQGTITYNIPSCYQGTRFSGIQLTFKDGHIDRAVCDDPEKTLLLNKILDTDENARYIGEFAIGLNPMADRSIGDTLFDEKMCGSFHFTPGCSPSAIHWDLVCCQRAEFGGGEIWFDDVLVRKDGLFVLPELLALNPAALLSPIDR